MSTDNLQSTETASTELVITRTFDAPRDLVWKVLTEADHLKHWWGPAGFTLKVAKLDLRPGGTFHYAMEAPNGQVMWGKFVYREIQAPERLVFLNSFSDENEGIQRAPFSGTWPLEMFNEWTLTEEKGKATLHMQGGPGEANEEEQRTYREGIPSMHQGFGGTFDQLDAYLKGLTR
jgi:uncharacterized protein YndB with AHSA1/START domain